MHRITTLTASLLLAFSISACADNTTSTNNCSAEKTSTSPVTELINVDEKVGKGKVAVSGKMVSVHYTGWLYDAHAPKNRGTKFDSSVDRGQPFTFLLGGGQVIRGWDEGVAGMKEGGKRTLTIPSEMGYGARGAGGAIPPNATLIFDVELLKAQ